eukprot:TRINITY_DN2482_c0_g1_i1.p1 TRINITY_DN2482_c0_g1~~TRINITY_DN2482_c0_g1_i1.p1  ORF type:complete len:464 (+),score=88.60 TRINITY_DN2482_c0_g1_i1:125-1516(+)
MSHPKDTAAAAPKPKTLKIGYLVRFKEKLTVLTALRARFCVLSSANELTWYRDTSSPDPTRIGSIKRLESCKIEQIDDLDGHQWCFSIKIGRRTNYFGAMSHQDRNNWMIEILKLKQPAKLIAVLEHPKLSKHAAFALLNLHLSKEHGETVIKLGATQALVSFLDKLKPAVPDDAKLIDSIFIVISKLCERREDLKHELGQLFPTMCNLFARTRDKKHQEWVTQGISDWCTLDENRTRLAEQGGIQWLVDNLSQEIGAKAIFNITKTIVRLSQNDRVRATIRDEYLDKIVVVIGKVKETVKIDIIQMLMDLANTDDSILDKLKKVALVPTLVPLLISYYAPLQAAALSFIYFMTNGTGNLLLFQGVRTMFATVSSTDGKLRVWSEEGECIQTIETGQYAIDAMTRIQDGSVVTANGDRIETTIFYGSSLVCLCNATIWKSKGLYDAKSLKGVLPEELYRLCFG